MTFAVFSTDHDQDDVLRCGAGIAAACDVVRDAATAGRTPPAILLVGPFREADVHAHSAGRPGAAVLTWPGLRYLPYYFSCDQLRDAVEAARGGRGAPPPPPAPSELVKIADDAQHWLESLCRRHVGEQVIFADALEGRIALSRRMLDAAPWLSEEHKASLGRLQAALQPGGEPSEGQRLAALLAAERETLRRASRAVEACKAALAVAEPRSRVERLSDLAEAAKARVTAATSLLEHVRGTATWAKSLGSS